MIRQKRKLKVWIAIVVVAVFLFESFFKFRAPRNFLQLLHFNKPLPSNIFLFASDFFDQNYQNYLSEKASPVLAQKRTCPRFNDLKYHTFSFKAFNSISESSSTKKSTIFSNGVSFAKTDVLNCKNMEQELKVTVSDPRIIDVDIHLVLLKFIAQLEVNEYYREVAPYFLDSLEELLTLKNFKKQKNHWYQLAGSSVWLESYGVYFAVRRIVYSPSGHRNSPLISLAYAQIYKSDWDELHDFTLIVAPGNDKHSTKLMQFPQFLPIPFYHDYDKMSNKYYGPEDPRLTTIVNEKGITEPLIVYNSDNRRLREDPFYGGMEVHYYRSMFVCFPFQDQLGKASVDPLNEENHYFTKYIKSRELKIENAPIFKTQKNWTPFLSEIDRQINQYDTHINFIYKWTDLDVLKCELESGNCSFIYRMNPESGQNLTSRVGASTLSSFIGPFRGGTPLLSLNSLIKQQNPLYAQKIPSLTEVWIGFARAHLDYCGCGTNMYRPNLVVVVSEKIEDEIIYKVSLVSSYLSLDVPIIAWDLDDEFCYGSNVFIPNGISSWNIELGHEHRDDALALTYSLADLTVGIVVVKGLFHEIMTNSNIFQPKENSKKIPTNDNVECALFLSREFCRLYGIEVENNLDLLYEKEDEEEDGLVW